MTNMFEEIGKLLAAALAPQEPKKVYDSMRPSATIKKHVDEESMVKVDDIKTAMNDLVKANAESDNKEDVVKALDKIADPTIMTNSTPEVDSYGLTKDQRRYLLEYIFVVEGGYFNHPNDPSSGRDPAGSRPSEAAAAGSGHAAPRPWPHCSPAPRAR